MLVRWSPPLRQLPACTAVRDGSSAGGVSLAVQLLRCDRDGCSKSDDAAIGPFSRQQGLPLCNGDLDQRHAARSDAAGSTSLPRRCLVLTGRPSRDGRPSGAITFRRRLFGNLHEVTSRQLLKSSFCLCRCWKRSVAPKIPAMTGGILRDCCRRLRSRAVR